MNMTSRMTNREPTDGEYLSFVIVFVLSCCVASWLILRGIEPVHAQTPTGQVFACGADNIGATLTLLSALPSGNCVSVPDGYSRYITDIIAVSTTATGGEFLLRYGTGTNCGTGTATIFPFAAGANVRMSYPGNTVAPAVIQLKTPIQVPEGKDLCVIGTATQTVTIEVRGYIGAK